MDCKKWSIANEARSAKLIEKHFVAIKGEWNDNFIELFKEDNVDIFS